MGPDKCTFPGLIRACSKQFAGMEGESIHGLVFKYGVNGDVYVGSSLIDYYGKCDRVLCAQKVFDEMTVRNEFSWTSLIVGYVIISDVVNAKKLFDEMPKRNIVAWNAMLSGFARCGDLASARRVFNGMPERNLVSFTVMIDGYAKAGDMSSARALFDQSGEKDIVSWSALIAGYTQNNQPHEAVKIFTEMQSKRVKPDEYVLVSLMCACSQIGSLEMAKWVESYLSTNSFDIHQPHVLAALIQMNAKCGNIDRATVLFEEMPRRNLISFCSMMQGWSVHGCGDKSVSLFNRMLREGLVPDDVAFTVILTACSRAGLVEEGCRIFTSMIRVYSIVPTSHHYACMVDLFGRAGKLKAAYELLRLMPVEPHVSVWGALLGACKMHCDIELGEEIASRLFEIEPLNGGNYVAMSDIYAQVDRWLDVSLARQKMNERGIRKLRGCSWI